MTSKAETKKANNPQKAFMRKRRLVTKESSQKDKPIPKKKEKNKPSYNDLISTNLVISCQVETVLQCSTKGEAAEIPEEEKQQHFPQTQIIPLPPHFPSKFLSKCERMNVLRDLTRSY